MPDWIEWNLENVLRAVVIGVGILWFFYRFIRYGFGDETESRTPGVAADEPSVTVGRPRNGPSDPEGWSLALEDVAKQLNPEQTVGSSDYRADWARLAWWGKLGYLCGAAVAGILCGTFVFGFLIVLVGLPVESLVPGLDWDAWYGSTIMFASWVVCVVGTAAWFLYGMREFWQAKSPALDESDRP
jgi:hypothetical protein